ncbi:hypothetical protein J6590_006728 [Homalodisca vitripennis]|nr:hypothetical protein J6590_006728 [Homalodisca vitripennis]
MPGNNSGYCLVCINGPCSAAQQRNGGWSVTLGGLQGSDVTVVPATVITVCRECRARDTTYSCNLQSAPVVRPDAMSTSYCSDRYRHRHRGLGTAVLCRAHDCHIDEMKLALISAGSLHTAGASPGRRHLTASY